MSVASHRESSPASVRCFVLTVSDTRTEANDTSGDAIASLAAEAGHTVAGRAIVRDDTAAIRAAIERQLESGDVDVVLITGGTGITRRDGTVEVVSAMLDKPLDGFGELFRMLSYADIGPAAMMSRAVGGLARGRILLAMPGSEAAVRLAMTKLIVPELGHLVREARR